MRCNVFDKDVIGREIIAISDGVNMPMTAAWEAHRKANVLPAYNTILMKWGAWHKVALELGLRHPKNVWGDDDVRDAMIDISDGANMPKKREWDAQKPEGAPTGTALRLRFGSWALVAEFCELDYEHGNSPKVVKRVVKPKNRSVVKFVNPAFFADNHVPIVAQAHRRHLWSLRS